MDPAKHFYGRERILREITEGVLGPQPGSFSLVGTKHVGKSYLFNYLISADGPLFGHAYAGWRPPRHQDPAQIVALLLDCDWQDAQQDLLGFLARRLRRTLEEDASLDLDWSRVDAQESPGRQVWQIARQLNQQGGRLIVLLDNFDRVFEEQLIRPDSTDELRPLTQELALVVATEQPLHDLDRDLAASPLFNVMTQLFVGLLEVEAARAWLSSYYANCPGLEAMGDDLLNLTGTHPFLLKRIGDILIEVQHFLAPGQALDPSHLELIRLRLAEHGRLLFVTMWRKLNAPPARIPEETLQTLLVRLLRGPVPTAEVGRRLFATMNWLINQAMVTYGPEGYRLFSPLFSEFLAARLEPAPTDGAAPVTAATPVEQLPIYEQLTKTEVALLRYFQNRSRTIVTPQELLEEVWNRPNASPRRVQEAIRRLRLQLADAEPPVGEIENERGRGYRFVPAAG